MGAVEPYTMMGLQPTGPTRVTLEVIIPSPTGLTPGKWKQTATLCPLDWPSNYSLLRLWHTTKSFHQYAAQLKQQTQHRHMFTHWEVNRVRLASRVLFQRPAHYVPEATLRQHVQERVFPDRRLRRKRKKLTGLPFRRNVMNCGSMPQGRRSLIRSPLQSGTAGRTLSEQINNTTLNILHGV